MALIVKAHAAPFAGHRPVVNRRHDIACDFLTEFVAENRIPAADAGGFKPMHASFMQNDTAKAPVDNNGNHSCRAFGCVKHCYRNT